MEIAKDAAFGGETVEVRRLESLRAEHSDVCITLVIGKDNNNVWQCAGWPSHSGRQKTDHKASGAK